MSSVRKSFERVDRNDPTLAVDGLSEFLPPESDAEIDPTLAVNTLHEFFDDDGQTAPSVTQVSHGTPRPPSHDTDTGGLADYFRDRLQMSDDGDAEIVDVAAEDPGFQSEFQRAALDFQRFAERFHAFASQCQQSRAL